MSDVVWQALIAAAVTLTLAWMNQRTKDAVVKTGKEAAGKAEEVKTTLEATTTKQAETLEGMAKVGEATHVLVNNNMAIQLKLNAVLARRLAETTKAASDLAAAVTAERLLAEHEAKQTVVDSHAGAISIRP